MKKSLPILLLFLLISGRLYAEQTPGAWRQAVNKMQMRLESGSLGRDFRFSFNNHPFGQYSEEDLLAYTVKGDGTVIIQMNDKVRLCKIFPSEFIWIAKALLEYDLAGIAENEPRTEKSACFGLVLRISNIAAGVRLYSVKNDRNREVIWQYLFRFGQILLKRAGLRDTSLAILPVCKGILSYQEVDADNDGLIDWLRLNIGFYSFSSGEFIVDFSGYTQNIFLAQGNSNKEFFLNAYILQSRWKELKGFLKIGLDAKTAGISWPYIMDIDLNSYLAKNQNRLRASPDLVLKGDGIWKFKVHLNQTVALEIKKGESAPDRAFGWFYLASSQPGEVKLVTRQQSDFTLGKEDFTLVSWDCLSVFLHLSRAEADSAIFEVGWQIPDKQGLERRIGHFQEMLISGGYHGNVESVKSSLASHQRCQKELEAAGDLEIGISYCLPPAEKI